jgi:hypothetical protein
MPEWHRARGTRSGNIGPGSRLSEQSGEYRCSESADTLQRQKRTEGPRRQMAVIYEETRPVETTIGKHRNVIKTYRKTTGLET